MNWFEKKKQGRAPTVTLSTEPVIRELPTERADLVPVTPQPDDDENVDLDPAQVENVFLRRKVEALTATLAHKDEQLEVMANELAEQSMTLSSLDLQLRREREHPVPCQHCGGDIRRQKVGFPKWVFHPTKEPQRVETQDEFDALGRTWRETPWINEPTIGGALVKERNKQIGKDEAEAARAAAAGGGRQGVPDPKLTVIEEVDKVLRDGLGLPRTTTAEYYDELDAQETKRLLLTDGDEGEVNSGSSGSSGSEEK